MTCIYNEEIFNKFRALAIQSEDQFVVGKTYYTNDGQDPFVCLAIRENNIGKYIVTGTGFHDTMYLNDQNIGSHYNPWLIFENEEDAKRCNEELKVTFESEYCPGFSYDDYDEPAEYPECYYTYNNYEED